MPENYIYFTDVTNRDGVQASGIHLSKLQRTILNLMLNDMGVHYSEIGFPCLAHEKNYIDANVGLADMDVLSPIELGGWVRCVKDDIIAARDLTKIKSLLLSNPVSEQMIRGKFGERKTRKDVLDSMVDVVSYAKGCGLKTIIVSGEDGPRTDLNYLIDFAGAAKDAGADRFRYSDTIGYELPLRIFGRCKTLAECVDMPIELHCHNDAGMAVANSIMGALGVFEIGQCAHINTTVNGVGERAGNADLVSCIIALTYCADVDNIDVLFPNIKLNKAWKVARYVSRALGVPIPMNQPAVGRNIFSHESGIHVDGIFKDRKNYELYDYSDVGRGEPDILETGRLITVGEFSGLKGFRNVAEEFGIKFGDDADIRRILKLVQLATAHNQRTLTKEEFRFVCEYPAIVESVLG